MRYPVTAIVALAFGTVFVTAAPAQTTNSTMTTPSTQTGSTVGTGASTNPQMSSDMQMQQPSMSQPAQKTKHTAVKRTGKRHMAKASSVHKKRFAARANQRTHLVAQKMNRASQQRTSGFGSSTPRNIAPDAGDTH